VILPPVPFPFVTPGPLFRQPEQRASDADRETAVDILCAAAADGRLTLTELEERVEAALSARTLRELAMLIADLIPVIPVREGGGSGRPGGEREITARGEPEGTASSRWALLRSLLATAK
jgi:hypothetical protein